MDYRVQGSPTPSITPRLQTTKGLTHKELLLGYTQALFRDTDCIALPLSPFRSPNPKPCLVPLLWEKNQLVVPRQGPLDPVGINKIIWDCNGAGLPDKGGHLKRGYRDPFVFPVLPR